MKVIDIASQETRQDPDKNGYFKMVHLPFTTEQLEVLQRHANDLIAEEKAEDRAEARKKAQPWWRTVWEGVTKTFRFLAGCLVLFGVGGVTWTALLYVAGKVKGLAWSLAVWWAM